ncbi:DNA repair protein XRCC3 [Globicephala melas]|uniref:DNA repair protein XRCC3 n=1 Tax=Globicephala melas TaxID=9731 RepID=UPI00122EBC83|nr:DNA repair protein XRCC3 [Globicephala melas]XP_030739107.1 DNA repair protein XRCC3 [Globicephala melas]
MVWPCHKGTAHPGSVTLLHSAPGLLEGTTSASELCAWESVHLCGHPIEKMDVDQLDLNPRIIAAVKKAKLRSVKEVLHLSGPDLQRLTRLSGPDVQRLLKAASSHLQGSSVCTALHLLQQEEQFPEQHERLSLGCPVLDGLLRGGLPLDGITELAGRSSAGKTQLALQLCLAVQLPRRHGGLGAGAIYVCTEDAFPSQRLQQLIAQQQRLRTDVPGDVLRKIKFGHQIFIEHAADVDTLLECVRKKVPVLLSRGMARLVVIDSVAAPFRCEFDQAASALRARHLQALGAELRRLSCTFRSPVLCINQVTESTEERGVAAGPPGVGGERASPALGITWSNQLLVRLMADRLRPEEAASAAPRRTLRVLSAPHLPPSSCSYTVTAEGVRGTPGTESC